MTDSSERVTARGRPAVARDLISPNSELEGDRNDDDEPSMPTAQQRIPATDLIGKQWKSQYSIDRLLAEGGMSQIWLARSADTGDQPVAVKTIPADQNHNREVVDRLLREARVLASLDDPNVVRLYDTGRLDDGRPVLVLEYVEGRPLNQLVSEDGPLSLERVCKHMLQIASALYDAHGKGITHRDIKPHNIIVTKQWGRADFIKVIDFGIVKPADPELIGKLRTRTKAFVGTAGFAAPEQALAKPVDTKADIYALGVVLYYELTGRLPYDGENFYQVVSQQVDGGPFPAPIELRPDTPMDWNTLVIDCIQLDPKRRPTAVEFANRIARGWPDGKALLRFLAPKIAVQRGPSLPNAATMPGDVATAFTRLSSLHQVPTLPKRRLWSVLALLGAAIGGGLGVFIVMRTGTPDVVDECNARSPVELEVARVDHPSTTNAGPAGAPSSTAIPLDATVPAHGASSTVRSATPSVSSAAPLPAREDPRPARTVVEQATTARAASDGITGQHEDAEPSPRQRQPAAGSAERATVTEQSSAASTAKPASAAVTSRHLLIRAKPFARVSIDGEELGETPPSIRRLLKPGTYTIKLVGPGGEVRTVTRTVGAGPVEPVYEEFKK